MATTEGGKLFRRRGRDGNATVEKGIMVKDGRMDLLLRYVAYAKNKNRIIMLLLSSFAAVAAAAGAL